MPAGNKTITSLIFTILAILASCVSLYVIGNLGAIVAYEEIFNLPLIKLYFLNSFLFISMTLSNLYLINKFFFIKKKLLLKMFMFFELAFFSFVLAIISTGAIDYIRIGDYLRDVHGINWYFMDWGRWVITISLYLFSLYCALIFVIFKRVSGNFRHVK